MSRRAAALCLAAIALLAAPACMRVQPRGQRASTASAACPARVRAVFSGRCVSVTDGDTIQVMRDGRACKVRLWGVDCPEKRQAFGARAREVTGALAFGGALTVDEVDTDRYGRTVGWVRLADGRSLNMELVREGMAWWYQRYAPHAQVLGQMEAEARAGRVGLWRDASPVPPWDFRSAGRAPRRR